jgi:hypothetical protein
MAVFKNAQVASADWGIQDMYLSFLFQTEQGCGEDLIQGWEVLDRGGEDDGIEGKPGHYVRVEIPAHEFQVWLLKDPCRLAQDVEVPVQSQDPVTGYGRQLKGQPSIAATYFQDAERLVFKGQILQQAATGSFAMTPEGALRMSFRDLGEPGNFLVGVASDKPVPCRGKYCRVVLLPVQPRDINVICLTGV